MKVAVLVFQFNNSQIGGGLIASVFFRQALRDLEGENNVDFIMPTYKAKRSKSFYDEDIKTIDIDKSAEVLNTYDYLVLPIPGFPKDHERTKKVVDGIRVPFITMIHGEGDYKLYNINYFADHPYLRGWMLSSEDLINLPVHKRLSEKPCFTIHPVCVKENLTSLDFEKYRDLVRHKSDIITLSSRWITGKRTLEFARKLKEIRGLGFKEEVWSGPSIFAYGEDCRNAVKPLGGWNEMGMYSGKDIERVYSKSKYVYNPSFRKVQENSRRTELCTIEGMRYGCVPILSDKMCATYFKDGFNAIIVDHQNFEEDLVKKLEMYKDRYEEMAMNVYDTHRVYASWDEIVCKKLKRTIDHCIKSAR